MLFKVCFSIISKMLLLSGLQMNVEAEGAAKHDIH